MGFLGLSRKKGIELDKKGPVPLHIGIIMDGNGRWAKRRGLPRSAGHREGANTLKRIVKECDELGIKYLTAYAFSTENWSRPKQEVDDLMALLLEFLKKADEELAGKNIRIMVIGEEDGLSDEIRREIKRITEKTKSNTGLTLVLALNYGSRREITKAAKKISQDVKKGILDPERIDEKLFSEYLYTAGIPDPDMIIRPSGERRLSNFLLWQASYAELWYSDILWPDFSRKDLIQAIREFQRRERRFGGL